MMIIMIKLGLVDHFREKKIKKSRKKVITTLKVLNCIKKYSLSHFDSLRVVVFVFSFVSQKIIELGV